jgi:putative transposase
MNPPKCDELDYIHFLVAAQKVFSNTEAARCHPMADHGGPAHDAYTRLLHRCHADGDALWQEVQGCVSLEEGMLILDDSTLDKGYARAMALVTWHWSGKHRRVVQGINLITLLWTDGEACLPCDFRLYDKAHDQLSKNDHFRAMVDAAAARGFRPALVCFDSWYASLANLKCLRGRQWHWLTQLKANRLVDPEHGGNRPLSEVCIPLQGLVVHLKGYGWIKVFRIAAPNGSTEHWATDDLTMTLDACADHALVVWKIEEYHRGIKQFCGVERAQHRVAQAQRNHIGLALRAFVRLEVHRLRTGTSWFEAKTAIIREAVRAYLAHPLYSEISTA